MVKYRSEPEQTQKIQLLYRIITPILLVFCTALTYWPSMHYDFQFDDVANIQKHFTIRHQNFFSAAFSNSRWISYWINAVHYSMNKFDPFSYRAGSLLIHLINGTLLFYVLLFILLHSTGSSFFKRHALTLAATTTMLFLLHPVQTQTVSYVIQGELEGLACMGILSMTLTFLYLCYATSFLRKAILMLLLFVLTVFSCSTKEIAIISPALILLIDWFFVAHGSWKSLKSRLPLHAALFSLVLGMYIWYLKPSFFTDILGFKMKAFNNRGNAITHLPHEVIKPWSFFISQFKVILHYLWIFIWPFNISIDYDYVLCRSFFSPDCFFPFIGLLCIAAAVMYLLTKNRTHCIAFGALWFAICIAPRSSIIPSPELLVDYKTYTASVGWLFILSCAILKGTMYIARSLQDLYKISFDSVKARAALYTCAILILGCMTHKRNFVWSSGTEFWMNVIQNAPGKARAYNNYGVELTQNYNRFEEAIPYFLKAARMDKQYSDPLVNVALCYSALKQIDEAIDALTRGLTINRYNPEGFNNLATLYLDKGDHAKAEEYFLIALQLRPHYGKAYFNLSRLYTQQNQLKKALECLKKACTIADLDNAFGYQEYANLARSIKEYDEAIWGYKKLLSCNPNDREVLFILGSTHFAAQHITQAREIYNQLLAQNKDDLRVRFNLGETYLAEENYAQALACFKQIDPNKLPQTYIRLAHCYEKMGNLTAARNELERLIRDQKATPYLRSNANRLLTGLNAHYRHQPTVSA